MASGFASATGKQISSIKQVTLPKKYKNSDHHFLWFAFVAVSLEINQILDPLFILVSVCGIY